MSAPTAHHSTHLTIGGMTCASCARRVEKKLSALPEASAVVNFATATAEVQHSPATEVDELISTVEKAGYTADLPAAETQGAQEDPHAAERRDLKRRVRAAVMLSAPVIAVAMIPWLQFPGWEWVSLLLTLPVVTWAAAPIHRAALANLRTFSATMDTLVSLGTITAFTFSIATLLLGGHEVYVEVAAGVTTFILTGRLLERSATHTAGSALRALLGHTAREVSIHREGREQRVPIGELLVGDEFLVRPGETIATDGVVTHGNSAVDTSVMTGESVPIDVTEGDTVLGGTLVMGGYLRVRATRVGRDTHASQIARIVHAAQTRKARAQRLADRVVSVFVPIVLAVAALTAAGWLLTGNPLSDAVTASVAVLIIACPCALGLATPTAVMAGSGRASGRGIILRTPEVADVAGEIDTVLLDKTGTLTTGQMRVHTVVPVGDTSAESVLLYAGAVEHASEHPIGRAIAQHALDTLDTLDTQGPLPALRDFHAEPGVGAAGIVEGVRVRVGRVDALLSGEAELPSAAREACEAAQRDGYIAVIVTLDARVSGVITLADPLRDTSLIAVEKLRGLGLRPVLVTGDHERVAHAVARRVGIDEVHAGVLPEEKAKVVEAERAAGRRVAMVGDGVNDAAALASADLGIAIGSGTDAAIAASDITLMRADLLAAVSAVRIARATGSTIRGNLFWAFAYNTVAIPLAVLGFLTPMVAGAAMALSSVCVVLNSLRLTKLRV